MRLVLQDLLPCPTVHFSHEVIQWMRASANLLDYFLGEDFTFIRFHGFIEEPFRLPGFVTDGVFMLEACRQETLSNNTYGIKRNKKKIYPLPLTIANSQVTLGKRKAKGELTNLQATLGLVLICDTWDYNPTRYFTLKHESQEYFDKRRNPTQKRFEVYIELDPTPLK